MFSGPRTRDSGLVFGTSIRKWFGEMVMVTEPVALKPMTFSVALAMVMRTVRAGIPRAVLFVVLSSNIRAPEISMPSNGRKDAPICVRSTRPLELITRSATRLKLRPKMTSFASACTLSPVLPTVRSNVPVAEMELFSTESEPVM